MRLKLFSTLFLFGALRLPAVNNVDFTYGTGFSSTSTAITFGYSASITNPVGPYSYLLETYLEGRVYLDNGAGGNYYVGTFQHCYKVDNPTTGSGTITVYGPAYVTPSGNFATPAEMVSNTTTTLAPVTMSVPTGCIPSGTYAIRVDMYAGSMPPALFPKGSASGVTFHIGSTFTNVPLFSYTSNQWKAAGFLASGTFGSFTVSSGGSFSGAATLTPGTCSGFASISAATTGGTSPYSLYYMKTVPGSGSTTSSSTSSSSSPIVISSLAPATYNVVLVDANGCRWDDVLTANAPVATVSISPVSAVVCKNSCVSFSNTITSGGTGYTYSWQHYDATGPSSVISTAASFCTIPHYTSPDVSTLNSYTLTVSNAYCTGSATNSQTVTSTCTARAIGECCTNNDDPNSRMASNGEPILDGISLELFPNPASTLLTVKFEGLDYPDASVEVYDASGKLVSRQAVPAGAMSMDVNVSGLPQGMYMLRLKTGKEELLSKTFLHE